MIFYLIVSFIFGLAIGSFLNCLVYRLATEKTLFGRSFCPHCGKKIAFYDNIPLLSFFLLRRKCRKCKSKISWQYPLVELATGLLFTAAFLRSGVPLLILRDWVLITSLLFIFIYDLRYLLIDDRIVLPAILILFILNWINGYNPVQMLLVGLAAAGFFGLQYLLTRGKGLGLGDVRIGLLIGVALGSLASLLVALLASYLIGVIISMILLFSKKKKMKSQIPLGPFLVMGTLLALFFGQLVINYYLSFF